MQARRTLIAGNWKMYGSQALVQEIVYALKNLASAQRDIFIFPPYVYLPAMQAATLSTNLYYGAQNCATHLQGAYTGEISPTMLTEFGCEAVILGHSERRTLYAETDALVASKVALAIEAGLTPILCIGESAEQRENNQTQAVLEKQLAAVLSLPQAVEKILPKIVIAYEPIWAIGTGKTATPELAQETHSQIRQFLAQYSPALAETTRLLYGGSVKADNAAALIAMPDIDGFLVGGASLDPAQFILICQAAIN